jgi:hypothetical protein
MEKYNESDVALNIIIQDKQGKHVAESCKLFIYLSKNALLEFGKELISNALHEDKSDIYHFYPAASDTGISINFGIIVHPESVEPIIIDDIDPIATNALKGLEHDAIHLISQQKLKKELLTDNIIQFKVFDGDNNNISRNSQYIIIYMQKYSKIMLGTELIRLAHNFEEGKEIHIVPASEGTEAQQVMGVYLSPTSCELIIKCKSFEPIDKILKEYNKEHIKS